MHVVWLLMLCILVSRLRKGVTSAAWTNRFRVMVSVQHHRGTLSQDGEHQTTLHC